MHVAEAAEHTTERLMPASWYATIAHEISTMSAWSALTIVGMPMAKLRAAKPVGQRARRAAPGANTPGFTTLSGRSPSNTRAISSPQRRGTAATAAVEK